MQVLRVKYIAEYGELPFDNIEDQKGITSYLDKTSGKKKDQQTIAYPLSIVEKLTRGLFHI